MNARPRSATSGSSSVDGLAGRGREVPGVDGDLGDLPVGGLVGLAPVGEQLVGAAAEDRGGIVDLLGQRRPVGGAAARHLEHGAGTVARWATSRATSHCSQGVGSVSWSSRTAAIAAWAWSRPFASTSTDSVLSFDSVMLDTLGRDGDTCRVANNPCRGPAASAPSGEATGGAAVWETGMTWTPRDRRRRSRASLRGATAGPAPTVRMERVDASADQVVAAAGAESHVAHLVARTAAVPAALLILIAVLNVVGAIDVAAAMDQPELWSRSTALPGAAARGDPARVPGAGGGAPRVHPGRDGQRPLTPLWALRCAVVLAVAAAITVAAYGDWGWGEVASVGALAEGFALLLLAWSLTARRREAGRPPAATGRCAGHRGRIGRGPARGGRSAAARHRRVGRRDPGRGVRARRAPGGPGHGGAAARRRSRARAPRLRGQRRQLRRRGARAAAVVQARRLPPYDAEQLADGVRHRVAGAGAAAAPHALPLRAHLAHPRRARLPRDGGGGQPAHPGAGAADPGLAGRAGRHVSLGFLGDGRKNGRDELVDLAPTWDEWWDWWPVLGLPVLCLLGIGVLTLVGWRATVGVRRARTTSATTSRSTRVPSKRLEHHLTLAHRAGLRRARVAVRRRGAAGGGRRASPT